MRTKLIGTSFVLGPVLMLVADVLALLDQVRFFWASSILFWLSFYCFIFLIFGLVQLSAYSQFSLVSACIALFGVLIGITIIGMSRFAYGMEISGVSHDLIVSADANPWVFFTSRFPGITFPVGLIMLVAALKRNKMINGFLLLGLLVSILLFPLGRIPKELAINVAGDALMIICFGTVRSIYQKRFGS